LNISLETCTQPKSKQRNSLSSLDVNAE
jgi:hypothetical protein